VSFESSIVIASHVVTRVTIVCDAADATWEGNIRTCTPARG
jgi:hypothetical protein